MASVAVMVRMIFDVGTWNAPANVSTRKTTTKKSNASRVQPRKLAATACIRSDGESSESAMDGLALEGAPKGIVFSDSQRTRSFPGQGQTGGRRVIKARSPATAQS